MSAHDPIPPSSLGQTDWGVLLDALDRRTRADDHANSQLPIAWTLHAWANDELDSAAIRVDGSEGHIGPAPARWRLLCHIDEPGFAVAVLDGRAPLRATNVLASLLVAPERPAVITVRGHTPATESATPTERDRQGIATASAALAAIVDLALGRCARVSGSAAALPAALRLAAALAMSERGFALAWSAPPRRGTRRPRAFVGTRDPAAVRRQLGAVEAALRKRERGRR